MTYTVWKDTTHVWRHTPWALTIAVPGRANTLRFLTREDAFMATPKKLRWTQTSPTSFRAVVQP